METMLYDWKLEEKNVSGCLECIIDMGIIESRTILSNKSHLDLLDACGNGPVKKNTLIIKFTIVELEVSLSPSSNRPINFSLPLVLVLPTFSSPSPHSLSVMTAVSHSVQQSCRRAWWSLAGTCLCVIVHVCVVCSVTVVNVWSCSV